MRRAPHAGRGRARDRRRAVDRRGRAWWRWSRTSPESGWNSASWCRAAAAERRTSRFLRMRPIFICGSPRQLKKQGIPIVYLIAPQAWAWRPGRVKTLCRTVNRLLCIFPFEQDFFRVARRPDQLSRPSAGAHCPPVDDSRGVFREDRDSVKPRRLIVLLPGSRHGEVERHMPALLEAVRLIRKRQEVDLSARAAARIRRRKRKFSGTRPRAIHPSKGRIDLGCAGSRGPGSGGQRDGYHRGRAAGHAHGDLLPGKRVKLVIGTAAGSSAVPVDGEPGGGAAESRPS